MHDTVPIYVTSFSHCLAKMQDSMDSHLKVIQAEEGKEKSATKTEEAADELTYLPNDIQSKNYTSYGQDDARSIRLCFH